MTPEQLAKILSKRGSGKSVIRGSDLLDQSDRTLIYGYDVDKNTFHVYLRNGGIFIHCYKGWHYMMKTIYRYDESQIDANDSYLPDKRVYPSKSDYDFCTMLEQSGIEVNFTSLSEIPEILQGVYWGEV